MHLKPDNDKRGGDERLLFADEWGNNRDELHLKEDRRAKEAPAENREARKERGEERAELEETVRKRATVQTVPEDQMRPTTVDEMITNVG